MSKIKELQKQIDKERKKEEKQKIVIDTIPSYLHPLKRLQYKNQLKVNLVEDFRKTIKYGKTEYNPDEKDIKEYQEQINKLRLSELQSIGIIYKDKQKFGLGDKIRKLNRKKCYLITIFNDNNTSDNFVINKYSRTFSKEKKKYLLEPGKGIVNPKAQMLQLFYFYNNPFPILIKKNHLPEGNPDSELLQQTLHFEYLQALAQVVRINKKMDMAVMFSVLGFIASAITVIMCAVGFKFI